MPPSDPHVARSRPKVSIMLITYNHEPFIAQSIEGILAQETEYTYEIDVIEDCSTDRTQEILLKYKELYPEKINLYLNKKNVGTLSPPQQKVFHKGFRVLKGEYIAILEGDDYWSCPNKLQKQVAFLDANPEYMACAHNTVKIYDDGSQEPHRFLYWEGMKSTHTVSDFAEMTSFFHTSSVLYRNVMNGIPPISFKSKWSCDIFNTLAHVQYGPLRYFDEDMSVYRMHKGGSFSNIPPKNGRIFNIEGLRRYNRWLGYRYLKEFSFTIYRLCVTLIRDSEAGRLSPLTRLERLKYNSIATLYGCIYDLLDGRPELDPAVFLYNQARKPSQPRIERVTAFLS